MSEKTMLFPDIRGGVVRLSFTTHSVDGLAQLKALKPPYIRSSLLQEGSVNISKFKQLINAGFKVFPVVTSQRAATISDNQWRSYINKVIPALPVIAGTNGKRLVQIGNEWNTQPFYGGAVNATRAFQLTKMAVEMFRKAYPCIIILGGVTNEYKNASNKMSARAWIDAFINQGIEKYINFWALHHYKEDGHESVFADNISHLNKVSSKKVIITETGSSTDPAGWYKTIIKSTYKVYAWCWYCFAGDTTDPRFNVLGSPLYNVIKEAL